MTAKQYLRRAYDLECGINAKIQQIQRLRELAQQCTAFISGMPGDKNHGKSHIEETVCKIADYESELNNDIDLLVDTKKEIAGTIKKVPSVTLQNLLEMRYLCFLPWEDIAASLFLTKGYVYKLHRAGIREIAKILDLDTK